MNVTRTSASVVDSITPASVVDSIDAMLGYWDLELRCRYANAAYKVWFGRSQDEMLGIPMRELLGPLFDLNLPYITGVTDGIAQQFERAIYLPDGSLRHCLASYYPDVSDGTLRGFSVHAADVTHMKIREQQLQMACARAEDSAARDPLTGLPNRVNLLARIDEATTEAALSGSFAAVVLMDFDNFKPINDAYGHLFGDVVLKTVAQRMQSGLRDHQRVKRYGGDEFVLIVPNVRSQAGVVQMLRRYADSVCKPILVNGIEVVPSFSCGVSLFPTDAAKAQDLIHKADNALYEAKKHGKAGMAFSSPNKLFLSLKA